MSTLLEPRPQAPCASGVSSATKLPTVCLFGSYNTGQRYPRNTVLRASLRAAGVEIVECHTPLFQGVEEKLAVARGNWALARVLVRVVINYFRLAWKFLRLPRYDILLVGYGGLGDVVLARCLSVLRRRPIVYDAFISAYDVTVHDRGLCRPNSWKARLLWWYDYLMCACADLVLLDTWEHAEYFMREFGVPRAKFARVWIGTDKEQPADNENGETDEKPDEAKGHGDAPCEVVFWGTFIPVHGLESVVLAAHALRDNPRIRVTIIGGGQVEEQIRALAAEHPSPQLTFVPRLNYDELVPRIRQADVCLGTFGATEKAQRVVPCKVFECLYFGKPLITADTPAIRELVAHGETAWLVPCNDPAALAGAFERLASDPALRMQLAENARRLYSAACSHQRIGQDLLKDLAHLATPS